MIQIWTVTDEIISDTTAVFSWEGFSLLGMNFATLLHKSSTEYELDTEQETKLELSETHIRRWGWMVKKCYANEPFKKYSENNFQFLLGMFPFPL